MDALKIAIDSVYEKLSWKIGDISIEDEGSEYGACRFSLENKRIVFRTGKITPTKIGQFVTLWKRLYPKSKPEPLDANDNIDFLVVDVSDRAKRGQFVFDRKILIAKGIMSSNTKKGKTAFRLYPDWSKPTAKAAIATQKWQLNYFYLIDGKVNLERVKRLFSHA